MLQDAGEINSEIPSDDLADSLIAAVDGIGLRASLAPRAWPAARQQALVETMLAPLFTPANPNAPTV